MRALDRPAKRLVARSFGMAATTYDAVAGLQRSVGNGLLAKLAPSVRPRRVLDVGAGTGYFSLALAHRFPEAQVLALDIAEGMLRQARQRFPGACIVADAEALPLASASVDILFCNLAIQWSSCLRTTFAEFRRVLRPGGQLLFSTLGSGTLRELREAWAEVDGHTHVNEFADIAMVASCLEAAGWPCADLHGECRRLDYPDVMSLMRELKRLGARNLTPDRPRHLTGKSTLARMVAAYPVSQAGDRAEVVASFEVIAGSIWLREAIPA